MFSMPPRQLHYLSFIFPIYNEIESLPYLQRAILAWANTNPHLHIEILLVDDGSKDG